MKENALGNNIFFDYKMGSIGAIFLASTVFYINKDYGTIEALIPAAKQFAYTFFIGGILIRLVENLAVKFDTKWISIFLAIAIPSIITVCLTYGLHSIKGTPEPLYSTIPTASTAPFSFCWWALRRRKKLANKTNS